MGANSLLKAEDTVLVLVDVQGKLANVMYEKENLVVNLQKLIRGVKALGVPVVMTEQYPQGLGPTIPEVSGLLPDVKPIAKMSFSCCSDESFMAAFKAVGRKQVLMAGIEAHVCVYQTSLDLLNAGYQVEIVTNAVSSRTGANRNLALKRLMQAGVAITGTEMALFELLKTARSNKFKDISQIVK
jgi:nicotinamidase-related amidase